MSKSIQNDNLRVPGIVLRRTNYGEADRILNLITPVGKISAIAKGARREKSKLAGGIEMFSLSDYMIRTGRSELGIVASVRMREHYSKILAYFERMELAGMMLRKINAVDVQGTEKFYDITLQSLRALNGGMSLVVVESWFWLNFLEAMGEEVNLYRDVAGVKLEANTRYRWDIGDSAFCRDASGDYSTDEIKILRLMISSDMATIGRIKMGDGSADKVLKLARIVAKI